MTAPAPSADTATSTETPATGDPNALGDPGKKALDEERAARKAAEKAARDTAAKLKEYEDRDKSEADKLAEREAGIAARELTILKHEVAAEAKIDPALAPRLQGTTRDELLADAKALAKQFPAAAPVPAIVPGGGKPTEALPAGGGDPTPPIALNDDPLLKALVAKVGPTRR